MLTLTDHHNYVGMGKTPTESLKDFGFVCRLERRDQYFCIYKQEAEYRCGFLCETDISDMISESSWLYQEQIGSFFTFCGLKQTEFDKLPFQHKAYSLIKYFGAEEVMGKLYDTMSDNEAIRLMHDSE